MRIKTRKAWIGIGVATTLASVPLNAAKAQHGAHPKSEKGAQTQDAGMLSSPKSGESYLTDGGPKDTRVRIYRDLALMRGHLLVGGELVEKGLWDEALPHFLHPTEELYGAMERYIKLHKITPFDRQLKQLAQAVKARNRAAYDQAAKVVAQRLSGALTGFKRFMQGAPFTSFTAQAVVEVMNVARSEYAAAIEDGKFAKPVEYQDARGFVLYAEQMLSDLASEFEAVDKPAFQELQRHLERIKKAWPSPVPPDNIVVDVDALGKDIDAFVKQASRFH